MGFQKAERLQSTNIRTVIERIFSSVRSSHLNASKEIRKKGLKMYLAQRLLEWILELMLDHIKNGIYSKNY